MKKRVSAILFALVLILSLVVACSDNAHPAATPEVESPAAPREEISVPDTHPHTAAGKARGVFITPYVINSAHPDISWDMFRRLMGDYDMELTWYGVDEFDVFYQILAIEQAIADNLEVIFIGPFDIEAVIPALTRAREAGIIVGLYMSHPPLDEFPDYPFDFFVDDDDYQGAVQTGEFVSERFPDGANFVEVGGQAGHRIAQGRYDGFREALNANIIELDSQFCPTGWNTGEARTIMEDFLLIYGDEIDIVYCHWDNGAAGVIEAVESAGKIPGTDIVAGEIFIIGIDGNRTGYAQVQNGIQALSVGRSFTNMVIKSLENARILLDGGTVEKINWIPHDMVTLETIDSSPEPNW